MHGDVVDSLLQSKSFVKAHKYEVCRNGCKLFGLHEDEQLCPHCQAARYKDTYSLIPKSTMKIMSIGDLLAQMLANSKTKQLLQYRARREVVPGVVGDVFDGECYKDLVSKGLFSNPDDIAVGLFTDGFVNQHKGKSSYTIVHVIIFNFDPSIRYLWHLLL